jgi:hypothetical protein
MLMSIFGDRKDQTLGATGMIGIVTMGSLAVNPIVFIKGPVIDFSPREI